MTSRLMAQLVSSSLTQTAASSWTARLSSVVVDAVELACAGIAHKARAKPSLASVGGGMAAGAVCAPSSGRPSGPSDLFQPHVTQMYELFMQHAVCGLDLEMSSCRLVVGVHILHTSCLLATLCTSL